MIRLPGEKTHVPMGSLFPAQYNGSPTFKQLRNWVGPLIGGNRQLAPLIEGNIRRKVSLRLVIKMLVLKCKRVALKSIRFKREIIS